MNLLASKRISDGLEGLGQLALLARDFVVSLFTIRMRGRDLLRQIHFIGIKSQSVVLITGAFTGMVFSYWEQACALLNYGLLHEDLFFETSGEFFGVWELVKGILPQGRERFKDPQFLAHMEKAAQRFESWKERRAPGSIATMRQFMKQMTPGTAKAA